MLKIIYMLRAREKKKKNEYFQIKRKKMSDEIKQDETVTKEETVDIIETNENLIVNNFVKFFEPLIQNLDTNVEALRLSQCDLTNQIKVLLNRKYFIFKIIYIRNYC
jgi:hypothetical protein